MCNFICSEYIEYNENMRKEGMESRISSLTALLSKSKVYHFQLYVGRERSGGGRSGLLANFSIAPRRESSVLKRGDPGYYIKTLV